MTLLALWVGRTDTKSAVSWAVSTVFWRVLPMAVSKALLLVVTKVVESAEKLGANTAVERAVNRVGEMVLLLADMTAALWAATKDIEQVGVLVGTWVVWKDGT